MAERRAEAAGLLPATPRKSHAAVAMSARATCWANALNPSGDTTEWLVDDHLINHGMTVLGTHIQTAPGGLANSRDSTSLYIRANSFTW